MPGFFRNLRIANADKRIQTIILSHLKNSKDLETSEEFINGVVKLIDLVWADPEQRQVCHREGFIRSDLLKLYIGMVIPLLPNPVINSGGPLLAATLAFIEFHRLEVMMRVANHELRGTQDLGERLRVLKECAKVHAEMIYEAHLQARGPVNLIGQRGV